MKCDFCLTRYGFENLDFRFERVGSNVADQCRAERQLPRYKIAAIRTGQFNQFGPIWAAEYHFPP